MKSLYHGNKQQAEFEMEVQEGGDKEAENSGEKVQGHLAQCEYAETVTCSTSRSDNRHSRCAVTYDKNGCQNFLHATFELSGSEVESKKNYDNDDYHLKVK